MIDINALSRSLYRISDIMNVTLRVKGTEVSGSQMAKVPSGDFGLMPVNVTALALYSNAQTGVLFHLGGLLYAVVSHYPKTSGVCLFLFNGKTLGADPKQVAGKFNPEMNLDQVFALIRRDVVAAFQYTNHTWKSVKLPSP